MAKWKIQSLAALKLPQSPDDAGGAESARYLRVDRCADIYTTLRSSSHAKAPFQPTVDPSEKTHHESKTIGATDAVHRKHKHNNNQENISHMRSKSMKEDDLVFSKDQKSNLAHFLPSRKSPPTPTNPKNGGLFPMGPRLDDTGISPPIFIIKIYVQRK